MHLLVSGGARFLLAFSLTFVGLVFYLFVFKNTHVCLSFAKLLLIVTWWTSQMISVSYNHSRFQD